MLLHALFVALLWFLLATAILFLFGRRMPGPSAIGSLLLILLIEAIGGAGAYALGVSRNELLLFGLISLALGTLTIRAFPHWNAAGHAAILFVAETAVLYLAVAATITLLTPASSVARLLGIVLLALQCAAIVLTLSYTHELLDVICRRRWRRPEARPPRLRGEDETDDNTDDALPDVPDWQPRVALHIPCHDEPPDIVENTLRALARLDYPRWAYQVFVVDNNTRDPENWQPIEWLCHNLGFEFLHLEDWPGFKSGALNYALALTPQEYDIIGVVDADYVVQQDYLRDLVGYFADPQIAFVQTPQDYRDYRRDSTFYQRACYHAYRYFFDVSMPSRNERNAIIFGGTMGLIRADALRAIGGWDEWCITEDAEASLRLLARGYQGRYVNHSYGRGLMPLEFDALKRQRFRWCFGGIQILRKHWPSLAPWARRARWPDTWEAPGLTAAQRYHYLLGGLQWYGDALTFTFTALLLVTGWLLAFGYPVRLPILGGPLLVMPVLFWLTSLARTVWALRATRRCGWREALGAAGILWSLGWVVTLASIQGLIHERGVFLRTPKAGRTQLLNVVRSTTTETTLGAACWGLAGVLLASHIAHIVAFFSTFSTTAVSGALSQTLFNTLASIVNSASWWAVGTSSLALAGLALLQGTTYLTAPILCLSSMRSEAAAREARRRALSGDTGQGVLERRLLTGVFLAAGVLVALLVVANVFPPPASPSAAQQHTLTTLLGPSNGLATPTPTSAPTSTSGAGSPTPGAGATSTNGVTPTGSTTPGATPTATALQSPTSTPPGHGRTPTPHPSPTHHP